MSEFVDELARKTDPTTCVHGCNDLMTELLTAIEHQCGDEFCEDLDCTIAFGEEPGMDPRLIEAQKRLSRIYILAHGHNKSHTCYRVHDDWRRELHEETHPR